MFSINRKNDSEHLNTEIMFSELLLFVIIMFLGGYLTVK